MSVKIAFPTILGIFLSLTAGLSGVDVDASANELHISFAVPIIDTATVSNEFGEFIELKSPEANYTTTCGAPKLPVFVLPIGLPQGDIEIDYSIQWNEPKKLDFKILPAESLYWNGTLLENKNVAPKSRYYNAKSDDDKLVRFNELGWIRSQRIGQIIIEPIRYDPISRTISVAQNVEIRITFPKYTNEAIDEGDFENVFHKMLMNYEQAKNFRVHRQTIDVPDNPFANSDKWYRTSIKTGGVYAITRGWLVNAGIDPDNVNPQNIRIFEKGIGTLSMLVDAALPIPDEIPALFIGDDNAAFDSDETLMVYVPGPEWWTAAGGNAVWHPSPYCDSVSVWFAFDGDFTEPAKRLADIEISGESEQIDYGWTFVHIGENLYYDEYDGNGWYWQLIYYQTGVYFSDPRITDESLPNGGVTVVPSSQLQTVECNGVAHSYSSGIVWVDELQAGSNSLICNYSADYNGDSTIYFKSIEIQYEIKLQPKDGELHFFARDTIEPAKYILSDFDEKPLVWDIGDISNIRQLTVNSDSGDFAFVDSADRSEYYVFERSAVNVFPEPVAENGFPLWENGSQGFDYLILAPNVFNTSSLENYEQSKGYNAGTITIEEIMREFGFGRYDPTAIRNFLCYAYNTADDPKPQYAAFVGDGHYDYRHRLTDTPEYFPPAMFASRQTDVFYATFDNDGWLEMMNGRIPVRSQSELNDFVNKIGDYSTCAPFGEWRIRAVMVGDDEYRTDGGHDNLTYTTNTSSLIESTLPARMIADPVYLIEYPRAPSLKKPEAKAALLSKVDNGAVLANYIGHGNYHLWAHEHILNLPGDLSSFENGDYLPMVASFSCDVAQFYLLGGKEAIAELLVRKSSGGAVATISATSGSFASNNQSLNVHLIDNLFSATPISLSGALVVSRAGLYSSHDSQYIIMGDPAQILAFPYDGISIDINPDTLVAGQWDTVGGTTSVSFDGIAKIFLFAPDQSKFYESPLETVGNCRYTVPGKILFAGAASVNSGSFRLPIFVPKNLSSTAGYKIVVYAYGPDDCSNASGAIANVYANLESGIDIVDTTGPEISLAFDKSAFIGDRVVCSEDGSLPITITLSDEHGIGMGAQAGQGILLQLDDEFHCVDISQNLEYAVDDPTTATASYTFTGVQYGGHTVCVQAWDNLGNASQMCIDLELENCTADINNALPYPNPFYDGVDITFSLAGAGAAADVTLEIYTLAGRKIYSSSKTTAEPFDWIHWDGKSKFGEPVARGVYIYVLKSTLHSVDGKTDKKILRGKIVKE
ncbi:gliding motility-associated C-terminal domain-containing protein [bacterium]|nr:gliding motility-associated C-terminal domain-containing protein [bacterium]